MSEAGIYVRPLDLSVSGKSDLIVLCSDRTDRNERPRKHFVMTKR